jgi:hypothetical protein
VTKECVALSNAFDLVPPTNPKAAIKSTLAARKAITANLTAWLTNSANLGKLVGLESQLAANRSAFISTPPDVTPLYNALRASGSNLTLDQVRQMSATSSAQREQLVDAVTSQGLVKVLTTIRDNGNPFTANAATPDDGSAYCYLMSVGADLMALGALVALYNPELGALMAAIGAALFLYGEYVSCTFSAPDEPDYFFDD